jgi:cyclopropane fatty-acyl-phospholipid synthase-like methyltransferase
MPTFPGLLRRISIIHRIGGSIRRLRNVLIDHYLRIDTMTLPSQELDRSAFPDDCFRYDTIDYRLLNQVIDRLSLGQDDVVYELGCGLGRIVCVVARQSVQKCVGVELSSALAARAGENVRRLRGRRADAEILVQDAAVTDYDDGTVFILFNPFGERVLAAVLQRIRASLERNPRIIRMAYILPRRDFLMEQAGWLRCTERMHSEWFGMDVSFWASTDAAGTTSAYPLRQAA